MDAADARADVCTDPPATVEEALVYVPPGPGRDELARLVEIGRKFRARWNGRQRGFLAHYLQGLVDESAVPLTFEGLLEALELAAVRRDVRGERASPIERVNRVMGYVVYHAPGRGEARVQFKTLRNHLADCKKSAVAKSRPR